MGGLRARAAYPTLRKEREGWATRRFLRGIEPKSSAGDRAQKARSLIGRD